MCEQVTESGADFYWHEILPMAHLIEYWKEYAAAMSDRPYDPDLVQSLGLRFCDQWKKCVPTLAKYFHMEEDLIDYSMKWDLMAQLITEVGTT